MKRTKILIIVAIIGLLIFGGFVICLGYYNSNLKPVSKKESLVYFTIQSGSSTRKITTDLYEAGLIKNADVALLYSQIHKFTFQAGVYEFSPTFGTRKIFKKLYKGEVAPTSKKITFVEGRTLKSFVKTMSEKLEFNEEEIHSLLKDKEYLNSLIEKYWFLTDEILDKNIYYPLEGYLFPDTYEFKKDITIKEVVEKMLTTTGNRLETHKSEIENSKYTVHQILSMASITELEARKPDDRKIVSGVIYNRLKLGMNLGMDPTAYYAVGKDIKENNITKVELNKENPYNTRGPGMEGKIPIGPICNPSYTSIEATLNPTNNDYLYFFAEIYTGKIHFSKTYAEHQAIVNKYR